MKMKLPGVFLFFLASLPPLLLVSCGPAMPPATETSTALPSSTVSPTAVFTDTPTPVCDGLCPDDSMTATAAMAATLHAVPSNTPPPWATIIPSAGDLGWGSVYGQISDGITGLPLEGATVTCEHFSYTSPYRCEGISTTDSEGVYAFTDVFFHDTDKITLLVEAPGYMPLRFEQGFFTSPEFNVNLGLFPVTDGSETPTPFVMCTAPACEGGELVCGDPNGCPGGCGTICIFATLTP